VSVNNYDVVVLDRDLPAVHGDQVCRALVDQHAEARVLMLTAASTIADRVEGLELGADDYLPKPFERRELVARVRALLRRGGPARRARYLVDGFTVDRDRRAVLDRTGAALPLTSGEFDLLGCFVERAGRTLSRDQLIDWTRGRSADVFDRNIDVQMSRLRRKLIDAGFPEDGIKTVRNAGYILTVPVEDAP
jgi:two-component system OmpR family response regulator